MPSFTSRSASWMSVIRASIASASRSGSKATSPVTRTWPGPEVDGAEVEARRPLRSGLRRLPEARLPRPSGGSPRAGGACSPTRERDREAHQHDPDQQRRDPVEERVPRLLFEEESHQRDDDAEERDGVLGERGQRGGVAGLAERLAVATPVVGVHLAFHLGAGLVQRPALEDERTEQHGVVHPERVEPGGGVKLIQRNSTASPGWGRRRARRS